MIPNLKKWQKGLRPIIYKNNTFFIFFYIYNNLLCIYIFVHLNCITSMNENVS